MTGAALPPAVVLGLSPTGLHVVRELGRAGVPVIGVSDSFQAGAASRYLVQKLIDPDPERRLDWLTRRFPSDPTGLRPVLIPTSDQDIDFLINNAPRLAGHFVFQRSYADGLARRIMDKETFYELCQIHDIAYPRLRRGLPEEIAALRDEITYPCMIKPSRIQDVKSQLRGQKGWFARDATEFDRVVPELPANAGTLLVQEIIGGPESAITLYCGYFDGTGKVHQAFTARKLRQYPPGFGSASLVQSAPEDESRGIAEDFLTALGYRGIAAAEFKPDPATRTLKIIEINVRPSLWFSLSGASGKPTVLAAYHDLAGTAADPSERPQLNGVRWRYALKDSWSTLFYRRRPSFILPAPDTEAVGPAARHVHAVYARDDAWPVLAEIRHLARKILQRGVAPLRPGR